MDAYDLTHYCLGQVDYSGVRASPVLRLAQPEAPTEALVRLPYRLLRVEGPDAGAFLHRSCTQDVLGLQEGELKPAAFLDAAGQLLATCMILRLGSAFLLETRLEHLEQLASLLEGHHTTENLAIVRHAYQLLWEGVSGTCQDEAGQARSWQFHADGTRTLDTGDFELPRVVYVRRGIEFTRVHAAGWSNRILGVPWRDGKVAARLTGELAECLRMLAGFLRVGLETEPTTLALEADFADHISTTKGCYLGQESVVRMQTHGYTRKACLLHLAAGTPITNAQPLHETADQPAVGRVLHAVSIPGRDARLGIGYLPKDFQAIGTELALADGTAVEVIGYEPLAGFPA